MKSKTILILLLSFSGIVIGSLVGELLADVQSCSWLTYGLVFGLSSPIKLNLGVISLTFGLSVNLTLACIICTLLTLFFGLKIFRK